MDQIAAGPVELDADHEPAAADREYAFASLQHALETGEQIVAHARGAIRQPVALQGLEHGLDDPTRQRAAAERGCMGPRPQDPRRYTLGQAGADRETVAQSLGEGNDIGPDGAGLKGAEAPGTAHAGLYLIEHEQPAVAVTECAQPVEIVPGGDVDSALALDRLHQDGGDIGAIGGRGLHRLRIVVGDPDESLHQGLEARLYPPVSGGAQGRQGAAVEARFHDQDGRLLDILVVAVQTGDLDGRFVGLRTRVTEEYLLHTRERGQGLPQGLLLTDPVQVGGMNQAPGLLAQGLAHGGVSVPQATYGDAGHGIEIALTGDIPEPNPFAAGKGDRKSVICSHQGLAHTRTPFLRKTKGGPTRTGNRLQHLDESPSIPRDVKPIQARCATQGERT